jgi:hypothetical protein
VNQLKKLSVVLLVFAFSLALVAAAPVLAKKPDPSLTGILNLQFNLGWPGPSKTIPDWVGHITLDGEEYGMAFFNIGTGKPFDAIGGNVLFFGEIWTIYESIVYEFDEDGVLTVFEPGTILLNGTDEGVVSLANSKYRMNGEVTEAFGDFEMWQGRNVHMSGIIVWYPFGAPFTAPGICRFN